MRSPRAQHRWNSLAPLPQTERFVIVSLIKTPTFIYSQARLIACNVPRIAESFKNADQIIYFARLQ